MTSKIRIFKPVKAPDKVLVNIKKYNLPAGHLVLVGGTLEECREYVQELIRPNVNPFADGTRTTIEFREFKDGKNGRTLSFSFYGTSTPKEIAEFIEREIPSDTVEPENECTPVVTPCSNGKTTRTTVRTRRSPGKSKKVVTTTTTDDDDESPI